MVNINRYIVDDIGCWIWQGAVNNKGYGVVYGNGKMLKAHRAMYTLYKGEIAEGMVIDHTCNVRLCVNPLHLQRVTQKANALAKHSNSIGGKYASRDSCKNGHKFSPENTYRHPDGSRRCHECQKMWSKNHRLRQALK